MAKFLFPTGRKSYFMAVMPLSRIQRLAVGNRGGREARRPGEAGFCLLEDGALRGSLPESDSRCCRTAERSKGERWKGKASA